MGVSIVVLLLYLVVQIISFAMLTHMYLSMLTSYVLINVCFIKAVIHSIRELLCHMYSLSLLLQLPYKLSGEEVANISFYLAILCRESSEFCTVEPEEIDGSLKRTIRLTVLFALWYILNIGYNIGNKSVLNALPLPW